MTKRPASDPAQVALTAEDGSYNASIERTSWALPFGVRVDSGWLLFDWVGEHRGRGFSSENGDLSLLAEFAGLVSASDDEIATFARANGALGLCGHGRPLGHPPRGQLQCTEPSGGPEEDAESIERWRHYAARAEALLRFEEVSAEQFVPNGWVIAELDGLIADAFVRPQLSSSGQGMRITLGNGTLLGALLMQLMYVVAGGGRGLVQCQGCRKWFTPARAPSPDRQSWCNAEECRFAARRAAAKAYRRRNRDNPTRVKLQRGPRIRSQVN
ncbi:MAG: hypothetical protein ACLQBX_10915 [Candidatus Limnocylindrales bacterium]